MQNHYEVLGIKTSATSEEVRRAYRVLARRYHPDVNPGKASEERFKAIASAYSVLGDQTKRDQFDAEYERFLLHNSPAGFRAYHKQKEDEQRARERFAKAQAQETARAQAEAQRAKESVVEETARQSRIKLKGGSPRRSSKEPAAKESPPKPPSKVIANTLSGLKQLFAKRDSSTKPKGGEKRVGVNRISVVEVSISVRDTIMGVKKTVEISEPEGYRKVSVSIPPGSRTGSVVRMRSRHKTDEELVLIVRVAAHPLISMQTKGLVIEIPISISEAISGASVMVPTLEEPVSIRIPAGSQSGHEVRLKERGLVQRDGTKGDLFYRLMVRVPESPDAVGLASKAQELDLYYETTVRSALPKSLLEIK